MPPGETVSGTSQTGNTGDDCTGTGADGTGKHAG